MSRKGTHIFLPHVKNSPGDFMGDRPDDGSTANVRCEAVLHVLQPRPAGPARPSPAEDPGHSGLFLRPGAGQTPLRSAGQSFERSDCAAEADVPAVLCERILRAGLAFATARAAG